jgi:DNA polymerase-3 subunit epsilon
MIEIERPLVVIDVEATGTDPSEARVIQLAMKRVEPKGEEGVEIRSYVTLVDPGRPIPASVTRLTGLSAEDVELAPTMEAVFGEVEGWFAVADLVGYNLIRYDLPLLEAEWERHRGGSFPGPEDREVVDVFQIEKRLTPMTLSAVYERRVGEDMGGAHDAMVDVEATLDVLRSQVREEAVGRSTPGDLAEFARGKYLDDGRRLKETAEGVVFAFGKHSGRVVEEVVKTDPGYVQWAAREVEGLREHLKPMLGDGWRGGLGS